jgi:hypothetical protein
MLVYWAGPRLGGIRQLNEPILFDLAEDISEATDVAAGRPEMVERLLRHAERARKELGDWSRRGTDQKKLLDYRGDPNKPVRLPVEQINPADQHPSTSAVRPEDQRGRR